MKPSRFTVTTTRRVWAILACAAVASASLPLVVQGATPEAMMRPAGRPLNPQPLPPLVGPRGSQDLLQPTQGQQPQIIIVGGRQIKPPRLNPQPLPPVTAPAPTPFFDVQ